MKLALALSWEVGLEQEWTCHMSSDSQDTWGQDRCPSSDWSCWVKRRLTGSAFELLETGAHSLYFTRRREIQVGHQFAQGQAEWNLCPNQEASVSSSTEGQCDLAKRSEPWRDIILDSLTGDVTSDKLLGLCVSQILHWWDTRANGTHLVGGLGVDQAHLYEMFNCPLVCTQWQFPYTRRLRKSPHWELRFCC